MEACKQLHKLWPTPLLQLNLQLWPAGGAAPAQAGSGEALQSTGLANAALLTAKLHPSLLVLAQLSPSAIRFAASSFGSSKVQAAVKGTAEGINSSECSTPAVDGTPTAKPSPESGHDDDACKVGVVVVVVDSKEALKHRASKQTGVKGGGVRKTVAKGIGVKRRVGKGGEAGRSAGTAGQHVHVPGSTNCHAKEEANAFLAGKGFPVHAAMEEGVLADSMGSQGVETMGGADAEALNDAQDGGRLVRERRASKHTTQLLRVKSISMQCKASRDALLPPFPGFGPPCQL
ncbi:hypothetical protein ABBQ38_012844 [Trebouxia sp. C0009 RCD-2024]